MSENVELTLEDAITLANVIDVCAKRGAFEASEFEQVGSLRGRLVDSIAQADPSRVVEKNEDGESEND